MAFVVKAPGNIKFENPRTGLHNAVCINVVDIGLHKNTYPNAIEPFIEKLVILWELEECKQKGNLKGQRFIIPNIYSTSLGMKANLRKDLESWRGRSFTEEELKGFDIDKLIGTQCALNLIENQNGKIKVQSVSKKLPGANNLEIENKDYFPEWIKKLQKTGFENRRIQNVKQKTNEDNQTTENEEPLPEYVPEVDKVDEDIPF